MHLNLTREQAISLIVSFKAGMAVELGATVPEPPPELGAMRGAFDAGRAAVREQLEHVTAAIEAQIAPVIVTPDAP